MFAAVLQQVPAGLLDRLSGERGAPSAGERDAAPVLLGEAHRNLMIVVLAAALPADGHNHGLLENVEQMTGGPHGVARLGDAVAETIKQVDLELAALAGIPIQPIEGTDLDAV